MEPKVQRFHDVGWIQPPGHDPGALSKLLVNPQTCSTSSFDFRISLYRQRAQAYPHVHERAEHVYYVVAGHGLMTLDAERIVVGPMDTIFIPPGVSHGLENTAVDDLVFVVATSPPGELALQDTAAGTDD